MTAHEIIHAFFYLGLMFSSLSAGISAGVWSRTVKNERAAQRTFFSTLSLLCVINAHFVEFYTVSALEDDSIWSLVSKTIFALIYLFAAWGSAVMTLHGWRDRRSPSES